MEEKHKFAAALEIYLNMSYRIVTDVTTGIMQETIS